MPAIRAIDTLTPAEGELPLQALVPEKRLLIALPLVSLLLTIGCTPPQPAPPLPFDDDDDSAVDDDDSAADDDDSAADDDDSAADDDDSANWSAEQHRGHGLYAEYCAMCHGAQAEGYAADEANALGNSMFLAAATDEFLAESIRHGRPGTPMSAWAMDYAGPLSPQDVADLVAYLRTYGEHTLPSIHSQTISGDPATAAANYQQHCSSCHGAQGEGASAISIANPWFLELASDGFLLHAIDQGRSGTLMASWEAVLTQGERHDLVALLRSWAVPVEDTKVPPFNPDLSDHLIGSGGPAADFSVDLRDDLYVSVERVHAAVTAGEELIILDARPGSDYLSEHISGAVSVPFYRMDLAIPVLPQDRWIVTYCGCPHMISGEAAADLQDAGFDLVAVLDEGYYGWAGANYPVTSGTSRY